MATIEDRREQGRGWRVRYRAPDGKQRSKHFDKRGDADKWLHENETHISGDTWIDPRSGRVLLGDWSKEWLESRINLRGATRARDESLVRNHVLPVFGDAQLPRITKMDVQKWVRQLSADGKSPATVRECYRLLGAILSEAVEHKLLTESPCRRIALPRHEHTEKRFLSADEVQRLADAIADPYRALVLTAAYLGCRWGELAGLKRKHLNLLKREVRIVGTIERVAGTYRYVEETKSNASRRTLRLPPFLVEILAWHLANAPASEYVFPSQSGEALRYDNFRRRAWKSGVEAAGLGHVTFHELRHTAAALMIDQGADHLQVQRRLGHANVSTTLGKYGHLFPNREDDLNDRLESLFQSSRNDPDVAPVWPQPSAKVSQVRH
ncbi:MAG: site-specific integrase [Actinomycetota bacterium]|nr:site-specific integrase [Actinomycetota bacterium]